jgi:hypothetical protein
MCEGSHISKKCRMPMEGRLMQVVNGYFNTPKVRSFILDLIKDHDRKKYSDLTYADKCAFASILINTSEKSAEAECIIESNDLFQIIYFLKDALLGNRIADQNLITTIKNVAVEYYEETMEILFESVLNDYEIDQADWNKYLIRNGDPDDVYNDRRNAL